MSRVSLLPLVLAAALIAAPASFAQMTPAGTASVAPSKSSGPIKPGDRDCLRSTGSRIPARKGGCLPVVGHSYSREEILRTGSPDAGGALRQLDPSVQVHGH